MSSSRAPAPACSQAPLGVSCCCCKLCDMGGCDVRVMACGCCLHARCCPVSENKQLAQCPICSKPASSLQLMPMNFEEIDHASEQAALTAISDKRGKKRKNATIARLTSSNIADGEAGSVAGSVTASANADSSDLRTGRWTQEETDYCDILIRFFEEGKLPIPDGIKLNEFLANMLKSKQSRLTKKMKNAKLSSRQYKHVSGYVANAEEARGFSRLETEFFASIKCALERSEIRFHMQKEWRELFSSFCVAIGQALDANAWLYSVEELERRASKQRDAARMVRRKVMMGHALNNDASNSKQRGVHIAVPAPDQMQDQHQDKQMQQGASSMNTLAAVARAAHPSTEAPHSAGGTLAAKQSEILHEMAKHDRNPMKHYASPFVERVLHIIRRYKVPFEHVDAWVPSFVEPAAKADDSAAGDQDSNCRLCFAGCGTVDDKIPPAGGSAVPLSSDSKFNFRCFGEYSQKFSFDVGCGLPGRVYNSGVASWEQGIQNAPLAQFERCGGAAQWGIQTVLGIPIASPTVGRVVILFYSTHDRPRNLSLVNRLSDELGKLRPAPKWKLVVDIGVGPPPKPTNSTDEEVRLHHELLALIEKCTPADKSSPLAPYLPGFTSLGLLLSNQTQSARDAELIKSVLACYSSYRKVGRSDVDIASMTARDFMLISRQNISVGTREIESSISSNSGSRSSVAGQIPQQSTSVAQQQQLQQLLLSSQQQQTVQQTLQLQPTNPLLAANVMGQPFKSVFPQGANAAGNTNNLNSADLQLIDAPVAGSGNSETTDNLLEHPYQHFLMDNPMNSGGAEQFPSLGPSPALQPISSQVDAVSGIAPLGLTANQITALLQNDASMNEF